MICEHRQREVQSQSQSRSQAMSSVCLLVTTTYPVSLRRSALRAFGAIPCFVVD